MLVQVDGLFPSTPGQSGLQTSSCRSLVATVLQDGLTTSGDLTGNILNFRRQALWGVKESQRTAVRREIYSRVRVANI